MFNNRVLYYGGTDQIGFEISYLLLSYKINHDFVFMPDNNIIVVQNIREIHGYEDIIQWIISLNTQWTSGGKMFWISLVSAFGLSVIFIEKREDFPVSFFHSLFVKIIRLFRYEKLEKVAFCIVCFSFWAALLTDLFIYFMYEKSYFMWPLTGFAASGLTWLVIDFLNTIDKDN